MKHSPATPTRDRDRHALRLEVLSDPDAFDALAVAWDALMDRADDANVFLSRAWTGAWWRTFGAGPATHSSNSKLHIIAIWRGPTLVGLAPLLTARIGVGGASLRMLVGIGQENADIGGALIDRDDPEARDVLLDHLGREVMRGRTVVNLARLEPDSHLLAGVQSQLGGNQHRIRREHDEVYPLLDLRTFDDPEASVDRLFKRNDVARRLRRLSEQGEVTWEYNEPGAVGPRLQTFFDLHDRRWAGRSPTGPFAAGSGRLFLADACTGLSEQGYLRLSFVSLDGQPIVGRFGTEFGGGYQGMKSGWDPAFASFGPGHMVTGRVVQEAMQRGLHSVDLLRGGGPHKLVWSSTSRRVGYWTIGREGRFSDLEHRALWLMLRLRYRWRSQMRIPTS